MENEKVLKEATVCFLVKGDGILLAKKARLIGEGCWNGYGGGIEPGETPRQAAARELREESGGVEIEVEDLEKIAEIDFENMTSGGSVFICKVHFFVTRRWNGEARETEEMLDPTWFPIGELPLDQMMPADRVWLPVALGGAKVVASPKYGPFQKALREDFVVDTVESFDD